MSYFQPKVGNPVSTFPHAQLAFQSFSIASENYLLGEFELEGISPALRRVPCIKACFDIDANGILRVSAKDKASGKEIGITLTNVQGSLSKREIDWMIEDAEKFKAEDERHRKKALAKNDLDDYIYDMKKAMKDKEISSMISPKEMMKIRGAIVRVLLWLDVDQHAEADYFERRKEELVKACVPISIAMSLHGDADDGMEDCRLNLLCDISGDPF